MGDGQSIDGEWAATGAEENAAGAGIALDGEQFLAAFGVPNSDRAIGAAAWPDACRRC